MSAAPSALRSMAAVCVIAAITTGCHHDEPEGDGPLNAGTKTERMESQSGVRMNAPLGSDRSVGGLDMCTRAGALTITQIRFTAAGAKVVDAKLYLRSAQDGTATGVPTLPAGGTTAVGSTISRPCRPDGDSTAQEIDVLLQRTEPAELTGKVEIAYTYEDKSYALTYPFTVIMRPLG